MKPLLTALACLAIATGACAQTGTTTYWVLLKNDYQTWCGYTDSSAFAAAAQELVPTESVRAAYVSEKLVDLTHQVETESGDWIVVDRYTPSDSGMRLRRANLLAGPDREIIQETVIRQGRAEPLRTVTVTTLDGKKAEAGNVDYPHVPIVRDLSSTPYLPVIAHLRDHSAARFCRAFPRDSRPDSASR